MLKVVLLDLDGVLVDSDDASIAFFRSLLVASGRPAPDPEVIRSMLSLTLRELLGNLVDDEDGSAKVYEAALGRPYPVELVKIANTVGLICERLSREYRLAVVTSRIGRDAALIVPLVSNRIDLLIAREDYQNAKPNPEPLLVACARMNVAPDESVYVGDAESDSRAARSAGMWSVRMACGKDDPFSDYVIDSLEYLEEAVRKISDSARARKPSRRG